MAAPSFRAILPSWKKMLDTKSFAENTLVLEKKICSNIDRSDHI